MVLLLRYHNSLTILVYSKAVSLSFKIFAILFVIPHIVSSVSGEWLLRPQGKSDDANSTTKSFARRNFR
jgi:hypothetical protein